MVSPRVPPDPAPPHPPQGAPTIGTTVFAFPYNTSTLTITVLPWPTGIQFPTETGWGPAPNPNPVPPNGTAVFHGENITVSDYNYLVKIGASDHDMQAAGDQKVITVYTGPASETTPPAFSETNASPGSSPATTISKTANAASNTSTTLAATPTKADENRSSGVSSGTTAGIAIGCLVAGALIAGILVWLCLGRSKKRRARDQEGSALAFLPREKTDAVVNAQSIGSGSPVPKGLDNVLSQPLEDKAISGEIAKLESSIKNHVQSYYHNRSVSPGLLDLDDLHALGNNLPVSTGTLSTLLGNPETRDIALRFAIAWVMIARMELYSDTDTTFLPPEIAKCFQTMSNTDGSSRAHGLFLANWRRITAELLHSTYNQKSFSSSDSRNYSIGAALSVLDAILRPFADTRMDNNQRRRNLEEILKRAANFAFMLFGHPSSWTFDWKEEQGVKSGSLCVFPALLQVSDDTGETIKPPRQFSDAVVRTLDG